MRRPAVVCVSRTFITKQSLSLSGDQQLCFCSRGGKTLACNKTPMKNTCSVMMPTDHQKVQSFRYIFSKKYVFSLTRVSLFAAFVGENLLPPLLAAWLLVCLLSPGGGGHTSGQKSCEKSVFINMHSQQLPLKRAFVAKQLLKHVYRGRTGSNRLKPDKGFISFITSGILLYICLICVFFWVIKT